MYGKVMSSIKAIILFGEKTTYTHTHHCIQKLGTLPPSVSVHEKGLESCRTIQENNLCPSREDTHPSVHYNWHKRKFKP